MNGNITRTICLSDINADLIDFNINNIEGDHTLIVTDSNGNILDYTSNTTIDFSGAGVGTCFIWAMNSYDFVSGLEVGNNVIDLEGCFKISNSVELIRVAFESEYSTSSVCFNMDDCAAIIITGDNQDYSEFTADISNDAACTQFTVVGDHLYRDNPSVNRHSCTPGVNGTDAMCVSALDGCDFVADNDKAIRFKILVEPGNNNFGNITGLNFYERAPKDFVWIDGDSGANNYPIRYGIRILKNGEEIYREEDIPTSKDWTLEEFDFTSNSDFTVFEPTMFEFELLSYCLIGSNGLVSVWDLDEIKILSDCNSDLVGGTLTSLAGTLVDQVCVDDGNADNLGVILTAA